MFGQGKFQNGVLIEPKPEYKFDGQDTQKLEEFRNKIWCKICSLRGHVNSGSDLISRKTIECANEFAPMHSRIFKEVGIIFATYTTALR